MIYSGKVPNAIKSPEAATELAFPHTPPSTSPTPQGHPFSRPGVNEKQIDHSPLHGGPGRQG